MNKTTQFRRLVEDREILVLPGVHDALTAKLAERAGFAAITCGGYATSASLLGEPDTSQLSFTEMADTYARLCDAVSVPVFGDGDTGYGNVTNVGRTVRMYERAGLAGMFIEDQVFPKRCGHMAGKAVVPVQDMVGKLKAALDARQDPDFVIMARTDAIAVNGIDDAIACMATYHDVGADLLFVEAPENEEQMRRICAELDGPCMANMIEGGTTPNLTTTALQEIGYAAVAYPVAVTYAIARAVDDLLRLLAADGVTAGFADRMMSFAEFNDVIGLGELRAREQSYLSFAEETARAKREN